MKEKAKLIRVSEYQKGYLDDIKGHPRETYIDVLDRLIATEKEIKLHSHTKDVPKEISDNRKANMGQLFHNRQIKLLAVDYEDLFALFIDQKHRGDGFVIRRFDLPEDYQILDVIYDAYRQSFVFSILSSSFRSVPKGAIPESINFKEMCYTNYKIMEKK